MGNEKSANEKLKESIRSRYGENRRLPDTEELPASLSAFCANGAFLGREDGETVVFRGIPYALPPVGERRWKRPEACPDGNAKYEAFYNGKTPIQTEWPTEVASYYPQGEDCLYLNVWTGRDRDISGKPVMVFFHGGSYGWGGTADPLYDGKNFVTAHPEIVLVTVGYRTGLMGFVDLSMIPGGEDYPDAPNLGLLDQIESLRWVKKNAAAFGGNPDNVTIFGESAGGGSVSLLPVIQEARGLFRRVIAQSGSVALTYSKEECRSFTEKLLLFSGAADMRTLVEMPEEKLKELNEKLNFYNNFPQRDGKLIPEDPYLPYETGETAGIDMLIGTNANEMNYWIGEIGGRIPYWSGMNIKFENDLKKISEEDRTRARTFQKIVKKRHNWIRSEFYTELMFRLPAIRQAEEHAKNGGNAYMYYWTEPSTIKDRGACHAVELAYVFRNTEETIYTGEPADRRLSDRAADCWARFAATGDPSLPGEKWDRYDAETRRTMVFSKSSGMASDILKDQRECLTPLLRYMINPSYAELDYNVPFIWKVSLGIGVALLSIAAGIVLFVMEVLD